MKIAIATGTRADWGLLSRLARALDAREDCEVRVLATNMHLDPRFGRTADEIRRDGFEPVPVGTAPGHDDNMALAAAATMQAMARELEQSKPDRIVVLGDRFEMLATASAALMLGIPIVHIAGGETSEGAIDDAMRHAITQMASLHLVSTEPYRRRVIDMGATPDRVVNAGAIGVDDMASFQPMTRPELEESLGFPVPPSTLLVTFHPATRDAVPATERFAQLLEALDRLPDHPVIITYPNNDSQGTQLIAMIDSWAASPGHERVHVVPSLGHRRYLSVLPLVAAVVGNSSSGIVEAPSAGVPTVDIGIRQKGRIAATSVTHCGDTADEIHRAILAALERGHAPVRNPYHRPGTLQAMVEAIVAESGERRAVSPLVPEPQRGDSPVAPCVSAGLKAKCGFGAPTGRFFNQPCRRESPTEGFLDAKAESGEERAERAESGGDESLRPLYVIPARGGSKGIPHKNIKPLAGRPLIHYAIDTALEMTADPRRIVVTTDDDQIARTALERAPVSLRHRPAELATDTAGSREVMLDAMDWAAAQGMDFNCVVLLQPTSPLRQALDVRRCLEVYASHTGADMAVTVAPASCNPYYDCFEADADGRLTIAKGDGLYTRRQDAPKVWQLNGAVYAIRPGSLRRMPMGSFPCRIACPMPASRSLDLDTPDDWAQAERRLREGL